MPKKKRRPMRWCFPATALLEQFEEGTWANVIAARLGVQRNVIQRWRGGETFLDPYVADRFAIKLGKHPSQIWTNWFDLPEYTEQQRQEILQCQPTNATANETESSQPDIERGDSTSPQSTSTSSSSTTTAKPSPSSNTATTTGKSAPTPPTSSPK